MSKALRIGALYLFTASTSNPYSIYGVHVKPLKGVTGLIKYQQFLIDPRFTPMQKDSVLLHWLKIVLLSRKPMIKAIRPVPLEQN